MSRRKRKKRGPTSSRLGIDRATAAALLGLDRGGRDRKLTWNLPRTNRDPRDPYEKIRTTLLCILTGVRDGMTCHDEHALYAHTHPDFEAIYQLVLGAGIDPAQHSREIEAQLILWLDDRHTKGQS